MYAAAEGEMTVVAAADVEPRRLGELGRVAVRRAEEEGHLRALREDVPAVGDLFERDADGELDRALVAQQLLDRGGDHARLLAHPTPLVGMPQQRQRAVADQVDRRL